MKTTCIIEGCERNAVCRGMCRAHYQRWLRSRPVEGRLIDYRKKIVNICIISFCNKPVRACGFCHLHYQRWSDYREMRLSKKHHGRLRPYLAHQCKKPGCRNTAKTGEYCIEHAVGVKKAKQSNSACKNIYVHSKEMNDDPEALTDEFIERIVGVRCERLEREKEAEE